MNANRLINMVIRMIFRQGMRKLSQGGKPDPNAKRAQQSMRSIRRIRKL